MTTKYTENFGLALPDFRMGPWHDLVNDDFVRIDAMLYAALSGVNADIWRNSTHYTVGTQIVDEVDATIWMCSVTHTSAAAPTTFAQDRAAHPTYWVRLLTGFAPRGAWAQNTQYFPYDLVYDTGHGIMALCIVRHVSTATGNINDDKANWAYLLDLSDAGTMPASAVSYSGAASGIAKNNVQDAIDFMEQQIKQIDQINVNQGAAIVNLQSVDTTHTNDIAAIGTRVTNTEAKNTSQDQVIGDLQTQINALNQKVNGLNQGMPSGTVMNFLQQSPPVGWNPVNGWSNRAIRLVDNGGGGGTAGGALGWSSVFDARTATDGHVMTIAEMPSHAHDTPLGLIDGAGSITFYYPGTNPTGRGTNAQGGNQPHSHGIDMRLAYICACTGQKA